MTDQITLELQPRDLLGKKVRRLRREGITPVHVYGLDEAAQSLQCKSATLLRVLGQAGRNIPVYVTVEGRKGGDLALVREVQREPVKGEVLHVDFLRIEAARRTSAEVPLVLVGESLGAREARGSVVQQLYHLEMEALPMDMPHELEVDLSALSTPDSVINAGDISLPSNVTLLTDPEATVARIAVARAEVEEEVEEEERPEAEAAEEGEEQS